MAEIIPTAEPFFFAGEPSKPACLLVHGFTGTPKEMRWMGEFLNQQGYTCLGIRLTGHATDPHDMIRSHWTDWTASVEDGYHLLRCVTNDIFLIGLSMGGVLSLLMSTRLTVRGVVAMSTPYSLPQDPRLRFIDWIARVMPFMPKSKDAPGAGWFDQDAWRDHIAYPQNPVRSIGQLNQLLGAMRTALPDVRVPVLLIHSQNDRYVLPENAELVYAGLTNAPSRTKLFVEGSGHNVPRDAAREQVFRLALEFIQNIEASKGTI